MTAQHWCSTSEYSLVFWSGSWASRHWWRSAASSSEFRQKRRLFLEGWTWFSSFRSSTAAIPPAPWSRTNLHPNVCKDLSSLIPSSSPAPCWPAGGSDLQPPLFAHLSGSWRLHMHLAAKMRWKMNESSTRVETMFLSFISDCCARGGRTLYYRETPGCIYRVLNLHGDAFLLEHSEHRRINSFNLCTRAQHQNLCTGKRKSVKCWASQIIVGAFCFCYLFLVQACGTERDFLLWYLCKYQPAGEKNVNIGIENKTANDTSDSCLGHNLTFHWRIAGGSKAQGPNTLFPSILKPWGL